MELREIIVWFGLVAIVVIVWDGLRRMKTEKTKRPAKAKQAKAVVSTEAVDDDDDWVDPEEAARKAQIARELPNGGARSRPMTDEEKAAVKARLNLRERVPMLMERVEVEEPDESASADEIQQTELDFTAVLAEAEARMDTDESESMSADDDFDIAAVDGRIEPAFYADDSAETGVEIEIEDSSENQTSLVEIEDTSIEPEATDEYLEAELEQEIEQEKEAVEAVAPAVSRKEEPESERVDPGPVEDLVVIHVMARKGEELSGSAVLELLLTAGLRHGPMDIFHYRNPQGYTEFSLANCVTPGTFDPDSMNQVNTPGVTLFMQLPTAANALESFEHMYEMAEYMARNLKAEILDEDHSTVTKQRREYYREKLRAYTRSKLIPS